MQRMARMACRVSGHKWGRLRVWKVRSPGYLVGEEHERRDEDFCVRCGRVRVTDAYWLVETRYLLPEPRPKA